MSDPDHQDSVDKWHQEPVNDSKVKGRGATDGGQDLEDESFSTESDDQTPPWLQDTKTAAVRAKVLLYILALIAGAWLLADLVGYNTMRTSLDYWATIDESDPVGVAHQLFSLVWFVGWVISAIVFLVWFRKAYKNLKRLGVENLDYSPNWAVGGFFVPILNLYRPYQVAREIAKGSRTEALDTTSWKQQPTPSIIKWWWGLFLVVNLMGWVTFRTSLSDLSSWSDIQVFFVADGVSNVLSIVSAIVAIRMIGFIMEQQESTIRWSISERVT